MWKFIDKTFVLSIDRSTEAQEIISKHLKDIGLSFEMVIFPTFQINNQNDCRSQEIDFLKVIKHEIADKVSDEILNNHLSLIRRAWDENYNNVLILEDDATFEKINEKKIRKIAEWLDKNYYDIFYFGYCNWFIPIELFRTKNVIKLFSPLCAHANLYSRAGMKKILDYCSKNPPINKHFDKLLIEIPNFEKFGSFPIMNYQNKDPGLYKRAISEFNLPNISFKTMSRFIEYISIIIPFILLLLMSLFIFKMYGLIFKWASVLNRG